MDIGIELVSLTAAMESHPLYCSFSPDGNKLAVTESNGNVMVWNVAAGCQWYMIYQVGEPERVKARRLRRVLRVHMRMWLP